MASNSLGTLTLDLVAKVGGFEAGMDKAERSAKKSAKGIKGSADDAAKAWRNASSAAAGAFAGFIVGAGISAVIKNTKQLAQEQAQLTAVLKSTGEAAGFSRDQLNQMAQGLADTSTLSAGEINQAQTALLAFTGVVGNEFVRAQQAAADMSARTGMSIVQAAETIGRALDVPSKGMAALSKQGFRFTDEQKEIVKHLEATGRAAEAQGIILNSLEESYGGAAAAARDTFGGAIQALQNTIGGLLTGKEGSLDSAKDAIEDLNTALRDPATAEGVAMVVDNIAAGAAAVVKAIPFMIDAGDGVVRAFTIAADLIVGIYSTAAGYTMKLAAQVMNALSILPEFAGGAEFEAKSKRFAQAGGEYLAVAREAADSIRETLDKPLAGTAMADAARQAASLNEEKKKGAALDEAAVLAEARKAAAARKAAEEAEKAAKRASDAARKRAEAAAAAIESELTALERAAKVWGMSADEVKVYDLRVKGATESQIEYAQSLLETVTNLEKQKKAQEDYKDLVADLRTEDEKRLDTLRAQMAVLDAMGDLDPDERRKQAGRVTQGLFDKAEAPSLPGIDAGPLGELSKLDDAEKELQKWYATQLEMLATFRAERSDLNDEWDERERDIKQQHETALANIERSRWQAGLSGMDSFLTQLQGLRDTDSKKGKQAAKAAAIVQATINAYTAATGAYASASAIPVVGWVLGPVAAAAALAAGLANVSAIQGMAHDGIDSVPQTGTWLLEKGERVTTAGTSAKLDNTLSRIQSDMAEQRGGRQGGRGGVTVNQNITTTGRIDNRTSNQMAADSARRQRAASARFGS